GDGVEDERAGEAVERSLLVVLALGDEGSVLLDERDAAGKHGGDLALGALYENRVAIDRVLDAGGHGNWLLADTRHSRILRVACESLNLVEFHCSRCFQSVSFVPGPKSRWAYQTS